MDENETDHFGWFVILNIKYISLLIMKRKDILLSSFRVNYINNTIKHRPLPLQIATSTFQNKNKLWIASFEFVGHQWNEQL